VTDVFLSYKAEDRARVAPLVQALETDGLSVWWDAHIGGGDEWRDTILRHLEAARAVVVVWSRRSVGPNGQFVRDEATRALKRGTYLPVRIDKVDPPLGFGETQALELHGWKGDRSDARYQAILTILRKRLGVRSTPATAAPEAGGASRRTFVLGGSAVAALSAAGVAAWFLAKPTGAQGESIAVLPFANLSGDPRQAYFSDGIAEELRNALSRIDGLKVVARTSSEAVRDMDAKAAAERLGVNNILTGSVRRSSAMIRVSAQLVDGNKGLDRWSEVYDRAPSDALQVQTDIANRVAEALSIRLVGADQQRLGQGGTMNADAHDLLLRAEEYTQRNSGQDARERAIGMVDAALAIDPRYGDAYALKAEILREKAGTLSKTAAEYRENYAVAEQVARTAIRVAPQSRFGYVVLANILDQQLKRRAALAVYQRMLKLPGANERSLREYATFLSETGHQAEALRLADEAIAFDPLNPRSYGQKANILKNARRYDEAARTMERTIELVPLVKAPRSFHAACLALLGRKTEALKEFEATFGDAALALPGDVATLFSGGENRALAMRVLERFRRESGDGGHYQFAQIYAQLGDKDEALKSLERAWAVRDPGLTMMLVDPLLDPVRKEPRFAAVLKLVDNPT
jgi:serine/threonine-protein kinase